MIDYLNKLFNNFWFLIFLVSFLSLLFAFFVYKSKKLLNFFLKSDKKSKLKVILIGIAVYLVFFLTTSLLQHYALNTHAEDLGLFYQIAWNCAHGNGPYTTLKHENFFREHFTPIYFLIGLFLYVFDSPSTLLIIQTVFLGLAALPLYFICRIKFKSELISAVFCISYLCSHFIHCANLFDFHQETLSVFFIFSAFYFFLRKRYFWYFIFITLTMMLKEDMSLYLIPLSFVLYFKEKNKPVAISTFIYSLAWFLISTQIIIPAHSSVKHYELIDARYSWIGNSLIDIIKNAFLNPFKILSAGFTSTKIATMIRLFLPVGFLNLATFSGIALFVLPLEANFLSAWEPQYNLAAHYAVPIIPFIFIGAVYGAEKIISSAKKNKNEKIWISYAAFILAAGILSSFTFGSHTFNFRKCRITAHKTLFFEISKIIPDRVNLSAQVDLLPHLSHRKQIYLFPEISDAEYVIIDEKANKWPITEDEFKKHLDDLKENKKFEQICENDGYRIFKRKKEELK